MSDFFKNLFSSGPFIPHGHCYLWQTELVWLHLISDTLIALAYYSIPITLVYFVRKRQDLPFDWIFLLFGTFIVACGTTHVMEVWKLWNPTYWLSGTIKLLTATVSLHTAVLLVPLVPKALALSSPAQLEAANQELQAQIVGRQGAEEAMRRAYTESEIRVQEGTAELATANTALHESVQRYRFLADAMPQIVWTAQPDGGLDYYNQRWYDYTGMMFEQTQGWGWQPVIHPDDRQLSVDLWRSAFETGENYEIEYRFKRTSDATYRWHLGRALPMRNQNGEIVQWVGTCTDINDQKRVEEALQAANDQLERRVEERTAALSSANAELAQAHDQALAAG